MASWIGPITTITASSAPRMALKRVNTLARTISPSVRLVRSPVSLVCPRATRSCTSAAVEALVAGARIDGAGVGAIDRRHDGPPATCRRGTRAISPVASSSSTRYPPSSARRERPSSGPEAMSSSPASNTHRSARPVQVAARPADGEQVVAGLELEVGLRERAAVEERSRRHRDADDHLVGVAEGDGEDRVHLLVLLDQPHHLLGGVAELLGRRAEVQQPAQRRRVRPAPTRCAAPTPRAVRASRRAGPRGG